MTAYMIATYNIADEATYFEYATAADALLPKYGGRVVGLTSDAKTLEGASGQAGIVIEFPSRKAATDFYDDPDYQALKAFRTTATVDTNISVIDGFGPSAEE